MDRSLYPASAPQLPDEFFVELAEENPLGARNITPEDAADWFYLRVWLRYKTMPFGRSKSLDTHIRMVTRWWAQLQGFEILEARHLRKVRLGEAKPHLHRPQPGSRELPQEERHPVTGELTNVRAALRVVR